MNSVGISHTLVDFLAKCRFEDIPAEVLHEAKRSILNYFGTALGGCNDILIDRSIKMLAPYSGRKKASVIGRRERFDMFITSFLNAISSNIFDFDDTHSNTIIHPSAPVASALFALAETCDISGTQIIQAFALGVETECRIGNAVSPWHYAHGWHITSTCGVFGAAVAVGKLLGFDSQQMLWALGHASAQSSGLLENLGTMAKSIGVGNSSRNGIVAALAAQADISGPEMPLEGPRGFCRVMGENPDFDAITIGLGQQWEVLRNTYKPYPCGIVLHSVIDACLELRARPEFALERISGIVVRGHPLLGQRADRPNVTTGREGQVSAQHSVAIVLLTGKASLAQFSDAAVNDPAVLELRRKIIIQVDSSMSVLAGEVSIKLEDGLTLTKLVENARGGEQRPLTDAELEAKFKDLVVFGGSGIDPKPLIDEIWKLDSISEAGSVVALAALN
jgi:2-methylcitrate dehydratase PrpD